ncbi:MAG: hypothetical protein GY744_04975 [Gammaproteobacteria bacterium]|nr:hypothetical protein [Gammaproteobacteria bacterium]
MMKRSKTKKPVPVSQLFKRLLPEGFAQKRAEIEQFQHFFDLQESDAVFQMVKVTNVTAEYLNVTLPNAALSSYLRLHSDQIRQSILENFGVDLMLIISTRPEVSAQEKHYPKHKLTADFSQSSGDQMTNAAEYIEDEELKQAMKSLSKTLLKK